ncbi:hypothetical protein M9458_048489, partial [Cirrhinus mrigala]
CVFLPALATSRAGIHTLCAWLACPHCERLPLHTLRSRKALFEEGAFTSVPRGSGPASAEVERRVHSWGSQLDLLEGMETGDPLSPSSPSRSAARSMGSEAHSAVSSPQGTGSTLHLSSSEEVDVENVDEVSAPQSPQYKEMLEVVTRVVAKLNIDWPAESQAESQRIKLDERFLQSRPPSARRSLPFFPDLHTEVVRFVECNLLCSFVHPRVLQPSDATGGTDAPQHWWARGTQLRVRLARVCTPCRCYRRTRLTCLKSWMRVKRSEIAISLSSGGPLMRDGCVPHVPGHLNMGADILSRQGPRPGEISGRHLMIKTVLLLALSSLKRVGDLQALSVAPSFLDFAPGLAKAFLYPHAGYVPKVSPSAPRPVVLQAFCPPPFREPDQQKLNCMCSVRELDTYVHRAAMWRKSDQHFVCYGPAKKGLPASKQTLSRWIVDAICCAYESSGLPPPLGVKAHSTRSMAASKAFLAGVSMQDICNGVG